MKKFNVLIFIIKMLKVGAWLTFAFTLIVAVIAGVNTINHFLMYEYSRTFSNIMTQVLAFAIGITSGAVASLLIYGVAELLDLLISIQENTYSSANVLRNMYRDQLNAQNVEAVHNNTDRIVRLRDVTPEGNVVEADLPMSNGSRR